MRDFPTLAIKTEKQNQFFCHQIHGHENKCIYLLFDLFGFLKLIV